MRHMRHGRVLGRSPAHRKALYRNLVSALFLTERVIVDRELDPTAPKVAGRIITTIQKAKEVRPLVEKCVTIAKKGLAAEAAAEQFATKADRGTPEWEKWRKSPEWQKWAAARAPGVNARRRVFQLIRDKKAVEILFETIAPRFADRPGGYTRILRLAKPRLGDGGTRAMFEFVGKNDRVRVKADKPAFGDSESAAT